MSDKQWEFLLDEFAKSSQCLTLLQEGILNLHGVMEQFQRATEEFAVKNEMDTLLPKVHHHFSQANDIYSSIADNLREIQVQLPAYQKLQTEVEQLKEIQQGMAGITQEISTGVQQMTAMQQELSSQMAQYRQMMIESREMQEELITVAQKNLAMNAFLEKIKGTDMVATEYFTAICEEWKTKHLDAAIEKWLDENLDEMIKKRVKGSFVLPWK